MNRLRILHLEDCAADAELVRASLEDGGCEMELLHVCDPVQYKAALEAKQFDAILVDNALPTFSGLAALKEAQNKRPSIPVIFLSGNTDEKQIAASLSAGATDYIIKENLPQLLAALEKIRNSLVRP